MGLLCLTLLVQPLTASADRDKWKSDSYPFEQVKAVLVESITVAPPHQVEYTPDEEQAKKVLAAIRGALGKRHVAVYTVASDVPSTLRNVPRLQVEIDVMGKYIEHIAAYDETKTEDKKVVAQDEHGKDIIVTVPTQVLIHHPEADVWHASIELSFRALDKNGKCIYTLDDNRERSYEEDTSGMLGRICSGFAKDITHN